VSEFSQTADNAIAILIELGESGWATPQKLAIKMSINRTVVQRLLTTLLTRGFVIRQDGEYGLSWNVRKLADSVQARLQHAAATHMAELSARTRETVVLQVIDGDDALVLHEVVYPSGVRLQVRHEVGARSSLTQSASGLAILAAINDKQLARVLRGQHDAPALLSRLEQIRETGIAVTSNELQQGVSGIATHLRRREAEPHASLAVIAPTSRMEELHRHTGSLLRAAKEIERGITAGETTTSGTNC
jgi:DNA-binding IclR family transcriptional regulator